MRKDVIIYRKRKVDILDVYEYVIKYLECVQGPRVFDSLIVDRELLRDIMVNDYHIDFFCGMVTRMGGTRPFLYNTDCKYASDFLEQGATKVNGKEIKTLAELLNIILEGE